MACLAKLERRSVERGICPIAAAAGFVFNPEKGREEGIKF